MENTIHSLRNDYKLNALDEKRVNKNPMVQFRLWFGEMLAEDFKEPTAVVLATSSKKGKPSARVVLLKDYSDQGFLFFTNYSSRKGKELTENPRAALLFYWDKLERQVRIEGMVKKTGKEISDNYFDSRPKQSRISAVVSPQSQVVANRSVLEKKVEALQTKFPGDTKVPRPEGWGGFVFKPDYFEFWQGRSSRLHDRIIYTLSKGKWKISRLAP